MIVCVPTIPRYLHPDCVRSINQAGFVAWVENVEEPNSYLAAIYRWFRRFQNGFIIVEHDVEILPAAVTETQQNILEEMETCEEPWCVSPYNDKHLLGCTKFVPRLLDIDWAFIRKLTKGSWENLDMAISSTLRREGYLQHVHRRGTIHHKTRYSGT